jgi:sirohydrochlorin cobaltochelatase
VIAAYLARKLTNGPLRVGQILVHPDFVLHHVEDERGWELERWTEPEVAADLARWNEARGFRPLKSAPDLRRGWMMELLALSEVRIALDLFYPAALGNALAFERGELQVTDLRMALGRQTGMYAVTKKITDEEADACVRTVCDGTRCLNHILWNREPGHPTPRTVGRDVPGADALPLLCTEACPLLVGAARSAVKGRPSPASQDA